jgi:lipoic acid synthetase
VVKDAPTTKKSQLSEKLANGPSFEDFVSGNKKLSVEEALELKETVVDQQAAAAAEAEAAASGKPAKRKQ